MSIENMETLMNCLNQVFKKDLELKFPFGNNYGWGYKISDKKKHMFYSFFKKKYYNNVINEKNKNRKRIRKI